MISKIDPAVESDSNVPVAPYLPQICKDSLDEKVIIIVGMCLTFLSLQHY